MVLLVATSLWLWLGSGCGVWIDDSALPVVTEVTDSGDDSDTETQLCDRGEVELYVGPPGDTVWAGQRIHVRFEAPIPSSQVQVSVVARDADRTELAVGPFSTILAADQVQIYEPPPSGWLPNTTHDLTLTYGENCSATASFSVGSLGFPDPWTTFGPLKVVGDLSTASVFPLGLDLDNDVFRSQVIVDFKDSWSEDQRPDGAVVAGALNEEKTNCGDSLYDGVEPAPGHGSLRVPYSNISVVFEDVQIPSLDGDLAVAVDTHLMQIPQMSLWIKTELLGVSNICEQTACRTCVSSGDACALVLLENIALERTDTALPITAFSCFPASMEACPHFCPI